MYTNRYMKTAIKHNIFLAILNCLYIAGNTTAITKNALNKFRKIKEELISILGNASRHDGAHP